MSIQYRIAGPGDREAVINFINYVFSHDHCPHDFKDLIPKEYGDAHEGKAIHFLAEDSERGIRGLVAALPFSMHIREHVLTGGFIGSVSVHPYARGEGHMKKLMSMANAYMAEAGMDIALLSGQRQRYEHFGYSQAGVQLHAELNEANIRHALSDTDTSAFSFREITSDADPALPAIRALHSAQPVYVERAAEDFPDICRSWNNHLYCVEKSGVCAGYLIAGEKSGTPAEPTGTLAELVLADSHSYAAVLKAWMQREGLTELSVTVQPWERELFETIDALAEDRQFSSATQIRVLNWERALPALLSIKPCSPGTLALSVDGHPLCVTSDGTHVTLNEKPAVSDLTDYSALALQERLFTPGNLLYPSAVGGAPADWFPLWLSFPTADKF